MRIKLAFSIAEMLIVVVILSVIAVAVTPFAVKKKTPRTIKPERGRYECFYDSSGALVQRYTKAGKIVEEATVSQCNFDPKQADGSDFIAISAIGGGGGGAYAPEPSTYEDKRPKPGEPATLEIIGATSGSGSFQLQNAPQWVRDEASTTGISADITLSGSGGKGGTGNGMPPYYGGGGGLACAGCAGTGSTICAELCPRSCFTEPKTRGGAGSAGAGTTVRGIHLTLGDNVSCESGNGATLRVNGTTIAHCPDGDDGGDATPTNDGATRLSPSCSNSSTRGGGARGGGGGFGLYWSTECTPEATGDPGDDGIPGSCTRSGGGTLTWSQTLKYKRLTEGRGGGAGETNTAYLIRPYPTSCTATIGKGGSAGTSVRAADFGLPTKVTCGGLTLEARGGIGSNEYRVWPLLMDGMANQETTKAGGVGEASNYAANEKLPSAVINYGYGGKGTGSIINTKSATQYRTYNGTSHNIPADSSKNTGADTNTEPPLPAEGGRTGAFVVIW